MTEKGAMTVREAGRLGGQSTMRRHGPAHYERVGQLGGLVTKKRHGHEFYVKIGHMGGEKVRQLVAQGREAQARRRRKS